MPILLSQFTKQLEQTFKFNENMELIANLPEEYKQAVLDVINYGSKLKGDDLKAFIKDVESGMEPEKYINNNATVENEALHLHRSLVTYQTKFEQLSFFSGEYMDKLKARTAKAQVRAEAVREERKRREEEEKAANGAIQFPKAN